jgi:predicted CopG family antitoxin
MQQIEIDFDVYKALTALRRSESHTYNEVIRELLDIDVGKAVVGSSLDRIAEIGANMSDALKYTKGFAARGLMLPNGTQLRATHKGSSYQATILDGKWIGEDGQSHTSPSSAASAITGNNVNGWRFWQAKRPSDIDWRNLDMLPKSSL